MTTLVFAFLPTITASLFQSPGGRKFLEFMNPFVRYVARHYMKVGDAKLLLSAYKIYSLTMAVSNIDSLIIYYSK